MTKEKQKAKVLREVMQAVAGFTQEAFIKGNPQEMPDEMQEIMDRLLETHQADDLHIREKMMRCRDFIISFAHAVKPYTHEQIVLATDEFFYV